MAGQAGGYEMKIVQPRFDAFLLKSIIRPEINATMAVKTPTVAHAIPAHTITYANNDSRAFGSQSKANSHQNPIKMNPVTK